MFPKLTEQQQAIVFSVAVVLSVATLFTYVLSLQPSPVYPSGLIRASLVVQGESWSIHYLNASTTNNTVFGILLEASHRLGFGLAWINYTLPAGVFVTSINGTTNGMDGKFWQYWVNGVIGDRAADRKQIVNGDLVLWKFDVPQAGA